ncbi:MAG TPA: DUF1559 domain-containing protein, partial [Planctomycetaceae bacterium]|nr:DUF1559 domain-containing protein [Planctomycetaceae bacterium]
TGLCLKNAHNAALSGGTSLPALLCPSSPLPAFGTPPGGTHRHLMPSYVGIAGATGEGDFLEARFNTTAAWCCEPGARDGWIAGGGMLVPNQSLTVGDARDGTSCTMIVGECSDWMFDSDDQRHRVDGGWPYGWMIGCAGSGTPPAYTGDRAFNITTIHFSPNNFAYGMSGVASDHGPNSGLLSAHDEGFNALSVDGHARYFAYNMDRMTLKRLATRDDGGVVTNY